MKGEIIWIIGASSGIGEALARELAKKGTTLILSARRKDALARLNDELGGHHYVYPVDVADEDQVKQTADQIIGEVKRIDRMIFMAALYRPMSIDKMDLAFARQLIEVNLLGAIHATCAILPIFNEQKSGQIALCGSVAGSIGFPYGQPYSATKAAIINFAESLYGEVEDYIDVKVINPGFVRTQITEKNDFAMPMRIEPEQAARAIAQGLERKSFEIHFPRRFTWLIKFLTMLAYPVKLSLTRRMRRSRD